MKPIQSVTVYCGSRAGHDPDMKIIAENLGASLAQRGLRLVYGGGSIGLMGLIARAHMREGGHVTGVIPDFLDKQEVGERSVNQFIQVPDMHTRKALMIEEGDAFVIIPGGIGTLEELTEVLTWKQLELHHKPIFLLNHKGYWQPFLDLLSHFEAHGFAYDGIHNLVTPVPDIEALMAHF